MVMSVSGGERAKRFEIAATTKLLTKINGVYTLHLSLPVIREIVVLVKL